MISIVTVTWNSYDWLDLLISSLAMFSTEPYNLIVVDNSIDKQPIQAHVLPQSMNVGHGEGLSIGSQYANTLPNPYVMFLDIDCHFLRTGWEVDFLRLMNRYDVIAGRGVPEKPIRPACMFMKKEIAAKYDWRDTPGYKGHRITPTGFDVAIQAYHKMLEDGVRVNLIDSMPSRYKTVNGEEWCVDGTPFLYHHWSSTWLKERQKDFPNVDLLADKDKLFRSIPWRQI